MGKGRSFSLFSRLSRIIGLVILMMYFHSICLAQAIPPDPDTILAAAKTDTAFAQNGSFLVSGSTMILGKADNRRLYFEFQFTKVGDRIRKIYLDDHLVYDATDTTIRKEFEYDRKEKYGKSYRTNLEKALEEKLRLKGKIPYPERNKEVMLKTEFVNTSPILRKIQLRQFDKIKPFYDFRLGMNRADDSTYQEIKHSYGSWRLLGFYGAGVGLKRKFDLVGARFNYTRNDDSGKKPGVQLYNRIYWWELEAYYSRVWWLSADKYFKPEIGYKSAQLRAFFSEDSLGNAVHTEFYNFSKRAHGPSLGLTYNQENFTVGVSYSWLLRNYVTIIIGGKWYDGALGVAGTNFRFVVGKDLSFLIMELNLDSSDDGIYNDLNVDEFAAGFAVAGILVGVLNLIYTGTLLF